MTIEQLRYFYEVAKCLNFSMAARNLYISQPNLTKYIANLEKELGFKLFDRSTHHCRLTDAGEQFMRSTERLFHQLNSHIENTKLRVQITYRVVNIGLAQDELPPHQLMRHLNQINASTDFRYLAREENYLGLIGKLQEHEFDLIVTTDRNVREMKAFCYLTLRPFDMLLAVHNSNPKAKMKHLMPKDCGDEIFFICIPEGKFAPLNRIEEFFWKTGIRMNISISYSPADVLLNTQIGAGVGIVPSTMDLTKYHDISYYRYEPRQNTEQILAWRKDETRPEVLSLVEDIRAMAPFHQPNEVPIFDLLDQNAES